MKKLLCFALFSTVAATKINIEQQVVDKTRTDITVQITPEQNRSVLKDFLQLSIDHPAVKLSSWTSSEPAQPWYDGTLRKDLQAFTKPVTLKLSATKPANTNITQAQLHISYLTAGQKNPAHETYPLEFAEVVVQSTDPQQEQNALCTPLEQIPAAPKSWSYLNISNYVEQLITATQSLPIRLLLVMLLGLLMSLTPCIYPMIPVTIGIMQGQGDKSFWLTAAHALAYSFGIATTFALLGLFAAASGTIFGMLLTSPVVVLGIVALMLYLAGSMFGWYEMRLPRFLQENNAQHKGSVISSFLFGAVSGTVASPCLSPGLALVLCIVAAIGNKFIGFLLLFAFGIGLSIPLMIIGTVSGSMNKLPRAGMWMIEVKKIFGFLLIGMAFYYLKNITPWYVMLWMLGAFAVIVGVYYLRARKIWKVVVGTGAIALAVLIFFEAYQVTFHPLQQEQDNFWVTDYNQAQQKALAEHKLLFLDFWAPSCSICTAVDKTLLKNSEVRTALNALVPAKIEMVMTDSTIARLKELFGIVGLPTFLVVDPATEKIIKRWGGELYHVEPKDFISQLVFEHQ